MEGESKKRYELKRQLRTLREKKGGSTELISVYVPPKYAIHEVSNKLSNEMGQAGNIKSKSTRKNVTDALAKIIHYLKSFRQAPPNGMAIFCGNVSENPAKVTIDLYAIEPPEPLQVQLYRCDSRFFIEPLENMIEAKDAYGLVVLDGREATIAKLKGTQVQILKRLNSTAQAKIRKGGQSARRYERLIEESIEKYYVRIGEAMDMYFVGNVKGVIVGGPGPTKENFMKMKPFNYQINVIGVVDTGYTDEYGIREVMAKSNELLAEQDAIKEKKIIDSFIKEVVTGGLATYGEKEVREAIRIKKASNVLLSEGLKYKRVKLVCASCNSEEWVTLKGDESLPENCPCGGRYRKEEEKLLLDDLVSLATDANIAVDIISEETSEGAQFLSSFYGIGAFLRYR